MAKFIYLKLPRSSTIKKYEVMCEFEDGFGWNVINRPGDRWMSLPKMYDKGYEFVSIEENGKW